MRKKGGARVLKFSKPILLILLPVIILIGYLFMGVNAVIFVFSAALCWFIFKKVLPDNKKHMLIVFTIQEALLIFLIVFYYVISNARTVIDGIMFSEIIYIVVLSLIMYFRPYMAMTIINSIYNVLMAFYYIMIPMMYDAYGNGIEKLLYTLIFAHILITAFSISGYIKYKKTIIIKALD